MTISELISKLNKLVADGIIPPESEIIASLYGGEVLIQDFKVTGVNWIYFNPDDDGSASNKIAIIEIQKD